MVGVSMIEGVFSIFLISIILKQYISFWMFLDRVKLKVFKYLLPLTEITLLLLYDGLFLFPTVLVFLITIFNDKLDFNKTYEPYYSIEKDKFRVTRKNIAYAILITPILIFTVNLISGRIMDIFEILDILSLKESQINHVSREYFVDYLIEFGLICIIAPIVEEFTFRVIIYDNWLVKKLNKKIVAVIISSLIFTFTHFNSSVFLYTFITGIILCFVYDILDYMGAIVVHMMFNTYAFLGFMGIINDIKVVSLILIIMIIIGFNTFKLNKTNIFRSRS